MEGRTLCNYPSPRLRHVGVFGWGVGVRGAGRHAFTCPFSKLKAVSSSNRILPLRVTAGVGLDPSTSCRAPSHLYTSGCTSIATDGRLTDDGSRSHHLGGALKERGHYNERKSRRREGGFSRCEMIVRSSLPTTARVSVPQPEPRAKNLTACLARSSSRSHAPRLAIQSACRGVCVGGCVLHLVLFVPGTFTSTSFHF